MNAGRVLLSYRCCILCAAILQECTPHVIMAFDLVGAMCKRVGNAGYTGSKHLLATEILQHPGEQYRSVS